MKTWVYKSARRANTYLYIDHKDDFTRVPGILLDLMGHLEFVLEVDLSAREKLAQADINEVRSLLNERGFFVQLPPGDSLTGGPGQ